MPLLSKFFRAFIEALAGILKELSDENPYRRHLRAQGLEHSPAEWRKFADARFKAKYARPKCC